MVSTLYYWLFMLLRVYIWCSHIVRFLVFFSSNEVNFKICKTESRNCRNYSNEDVMIMMKTFQSVLVNIDLLKALHHFCQTNHISFMSICLSNLPSHTQGSLSKTQLWQWRLELFFIAAHGEIDFQGVKNAQLSLGQRDVWWGFRCLQRCRSNAELSGRLRTASFCRCGSNGKLLTLLLMAYCFLWKLCIALVHKNTITIKFYFCFIYTWC